METENSSSNGSGSKVKADNTPVLSTETEFNQLINQSVSQQMANYVNLEI